MCVCVCVYCSRSQQSLVSICYKVSQAHGKRFFLAAREDLQVFKHWLNISGRNAVETERLDSEYLGLSPTFT